MKTNKYIIRLSEDRLPMLVKEMTVQYPGYRSKMSQPDHIVEYLRAVEEYNSLPEEHVDMLCFDAKLSLIGTFKVSTGMIDRVVFDTRGILQRALAVGASYIAVAHNHPSGDSTPSKEDYVAAKRIHDACDLVGIKLLDFIIVGENNYYSAHEAGAF